MSSPEVILDLASSARRFVKSALQIELDGTPDTLPLADHYLSMLREDEHREDVTGMVVPAIGAYFGEVCQTIIGDGQWHCPSGKEQTPDYASWRLICEKHPMTFNPLGIALECAVQSDASGWGAHFELPKDKQPAAEEYFASIGETIRSEDYYRLSIRLEVLESLYSMLSAAT